MVNTRVLVTGANGYVGARVYADLCKVFETYGTYHKLKLFPQLLHLDLTNTIEVASLFQSVKPNVIVHVAAFPSINACKGDKKAAIELNVNGTDKLVKDANAVGAKVIYISTEGAQLVHEIYGKTKLEAEELVKAADAGFIILRPDLIIGQSPNTINDRFHNRILKNIVEKTPAVYDNIYKFNLTWAGHLTEVITILIKRDDWNHAIPITVKKRKTRFEIASDILKNFGIETKSVQIDKPSAVFSTQKKLRELNLPVYGYRYILDKTIQEIATWLDNQKS